MKNNLLPFSHVYLSSASPRRRELLEKIGLWVIRLPSEIDESVYDNEKPEAYVIRMAQEKNRHARFLATTAIPVISADTAVVIDDKILGKPKDKQDAHSMLKMLSGRTHRVISAVCVSLDNKEQTRVSTSHVTFAELSDDEIEAYLLCGESQDKAGAYAIQGIGATFITNLSGSFSGVMGLPIYETIRLIKELSLS